MATPKYRRVIVKLSGEALSGPEKFGIHQPTIDRFAADLVASHALGIGSASLSAAATFCAGANSEDGLSRPTADAMECWRPS
jgi:uridylate kinase